MYLITNIVFLLIKNKQLYYVIFNLLAFSIAKLYLRIVFLAIKAPYSSLLDMKDFGANLKRFRAKKGFSQEVFATKIGVHVTNLSKYERNKSTPSLEIAEKMASALDMSLDEMVYGQQNEKARIRIVDNELLRLFNQTQNLSDDQKKTVIDLLSAFLLKANLSQQLTAI